MKRARPDFDLTDPVYFSEDARGKARRISKTLFDEWETHDWFIWISGACQNGGFWGNPPIETKLEMAHLAAVFEGGDFGVPGDRYGVDPHTDHEYFLYVDKCWNLNNPSHTSCY